MTSYRATLSNVDPAEIREAMPIADGVEIYDSPYLTQWSVKDTTVELRRHGGSMWFVLVIGPQPDSVLNTVARLVFAPENVEIDKIDPEPPRPTSAVAITG